MAARRAIRDLASRYRARLGFLNKSRSYEVSRPARPGVIGNREPCGVPLFLRNDLLRGQIDKNLLRNNDDDVVRSNRDDIFFRDQLKKNAVFARLHLGEVAVPPDKDAAVQQRLDDLCAKLRRLDENFVTRSECLRIVGEEFRDCAEDALRMLEESGKVLALGGRVYLRPEKIVKVLESVLPYFAENKEDSSKEELDNMQKVKAEIDRQAERSVRRELWFGLAAMTVQTAALMRLTFWELSWDVMEPVCFFITNAYFLAGYSFFLKTKTEPTLEGFFRTRFKAKQAQLMSKRGFNMARFKELQQVWQPSEVVSNELHQARQPCQVLSNELHQARQPGQAVFDSF